MANIFQFAAYEPRYTDSIAQLMMAGPNAQAAALRQIAEIQGRGATERAKTNAAVIGSLGDIARGAIDSYTRYQQDAPLRQEREARANLLNLQTQEAQGNVDAQKAEQARGQAMLQLFQQRGDRVTFDDMAGIVGPDRAAKIAEGLSALQKTNLQTAEEHSKRMRDVIAGMDALPENARAAAWPGIKQQFVGEKLIQPTDVPDQYDAATWGRLRGYGQPLQQPSFGQLGNGGIFNQKTGEVTREPEAKPQPNLTPQQQYAAAVASGDAAGAAKWLKAINAAAQAGHVPTAAEQQQAQMAPPTDGDPMSGLSAGEQGIVNGLLNYTQQLPSGIALRTPYWQRLLERARMVDPSFDASQYTTRQKVRQDFTSGKAAQNVRSLNTVIGHLDELKRAGDALNNSSLPLWNRLANAAESAAGDPRIKRYETAANATSGELATLFKNTSGTDQEIQSWRKLANPSDSPDQIHAFVDQAIQLAFSRLDALKSQYQTGMGKPADFTLLNPKSREILKSLGKDPDAYDPGATGQAQPSAAGATAERQPRSKPDNGGASSSRVRVKGPNGESGTVPAGTSLPPGWSFVR